MQRENHDTRTRDRVSEPDILSPWGTGAGPCFRALALWLLRLSKKKSLSVPVQPTGRDGGRPVARLVEPEARQRPVKQFFFLSLSVSLFPFLFPLWEREGEITNGGAGDNGKWGEKNMER